MARVCTSGSRTGSPPPSEIGVDDLSSDVIDLI
jgi:hypothetical protein